MAAVNRWIEETHTSQRVLTVPDQDMRVELRLRIREMILPRYASLYKHLDKDVNLSKRKREKIFKYSPDRLSNMISQYYENSE